jgi:hypothetical protein
MDLAARSHAGPSFQTDSPLVEKLDGWRGRYADVPNNLLNFFDRGGITFETFAATKGEV